MTKRFNRQSGQVLLIIIMILATVLALIFSISFSSQTETQTTKLEEEYKKSLAAAEAILEASLKNSVGSTTILGSGNLNLTNLTSAGFTGSATIAESSGSSFVTPLTQKDDQYTLYLSHFDNPGFSSPFSGNIYFYVKTESGCPVVELTYIDNNNALTRDLIDPCSQIAGATGLTTVSLTPPGNTLNGVPFDYKAGPKAIANMKVVIMRVLFNSTRIGIQEVTGGINLPSQGRITTAQAQTNTSVSTTIKLFQSNPQIPSDFFVTSF